MKYEYEYHAEIDQKTDVILRKRGDIYSDLKNYSLIVFVPPELKVFMTECMAICMCIIFCACKMK